MKSAIFLGVFFILGNAYLINARSLSIFEMAEILQRDSGTDRQECAKTAVRVVSNENADNIGDFHEKSDIDKMKTLHQEVMRMMRNGNKAWRSYARIYTIMEEELGGEQAFLDSYFGNYTTELSKGTINSTMICTILGNIGVFYDQAKESIGTTIGSSDKFWPMVKDMMSVDLQEKDVREAPTLFFATGNVFLLGLPNEMINMLTSVLDMMPEETFRQKIRDMGPAFKPFPFNQS